MAEVSISEAARLSKKGRATIQRHIKIGKLSAVRDAAGNPVIDTAELCRVYGSIQGKEASNTASLTQNEAVTVEALKQELEAAREREKAALERESWFRAQLEAAQARCTDLENRMLPQGGERRGFWSRLFRPG